MLDTENVFVNSKTKELFLLYVPVSGDCQNGSLKSFLEHLVFESSFRLGEDTSFKQELMNLINSGTNLNTKALEHYIVTFCPELKRNFEKYSEHKNANVAASKSEYLRQREALERRDYQEPVCKGKGTDLYYGKSRQIGGATVGTVVLDEDDGTVVLNGQSGTVVLDKSDPDEVSCYPNLIRKSTGEEICIETDGMQHEYPVEKFGGLEGLAERQRKDRIKNEYCMKNNIRLIRIPERYFKQMEEILIKELHLST